MLDQDDCRRVRLVVSGGHDEHDCGYSAPMMERKEEELSLGEASIVAKQGNNHGRKYHRREMVVAGQLSHSLHSFGVVKCQRFAVAKLPNKKSCSLVPRIRKITSTTSTHAFSIPPFFFSFSNLCATFEPLQIPPPTLESSIYNLIPLPRAQ